MTNNELDGLVALKLVAEKRNFTAAAKSLSISPSAMSQVIRQLEQRLGSTLLARTTRNVSLTEAGERFLSQVGPAIDQIMVAIDQVRHFASKPSGLLRINMPKSIYTSHIAPLVGSFRKKYPDVTLELYFEDGITDVVAEGFDAGIRLADILAKDMIAVKLFGPVKFVIVGSPKYFARAGRPRHPKDLLTHDCIVPRLGRHRIYDRWEFEHRGVEFQVHVKNSLIYNDTTLIHDAAINGLGVMYTIEQSIEPQLKAGKLEVVLEAYAATSAGFYLYYPQHSQAQPKLRAFIDHIKAAKG